MQEFLDETVELIFGQYARQVLPGMYSVAESLEGYKYSFIEVDELGKLLQDNYQEGLRVYWFELLSRAHLAATTSILRNLRWVNGALVAYEQRNFLLFSAAFRGYLESAADAVYALQQIPKNLADNFQEIRLILDRSPKAKARLFPELEEILLHYSHARNPKKVRSDEKTYGIKLPESHSAATTRKYLDSLGSALVHDCYSELCELSHPAALSVWCFFLTADHDTYILSNDTDKRLIEQFCSKYHNIFPEALYLPFNSALITLKVLNAFEVKEFNIPTVDKIDFERVPLWQKIKPLLSKN